MNGRLHLFLPLTNVILFYFVCLRSAPCENEEFAHGTFVQCRVLTGVQSKPIVEVSLRQSRLDGDLDDDSAPDVGETVQAFVVETSKKGCFLRLSRHIEGRTILKELCDGFLPDPASSFPIGRLVVGKVKDIREGKRINGILKMVADVDMRESILMEETQRTIRFENLQIGDKYKASVMRIEEYGVFVRLESSDVSGLVHKSECSDKFIKNLADLYDPGDLVKVILLKKDDDKKQVGFGMKASYFVDDEDSDEDDASSENTAEGEVDEDAPTLLDDEIASDDDNYVSKLSAKLNNRVDEEPEGSDDSDNYADDDDNEDVNHDDDTNPENTDSDDDDGDGDDDQDENEDEVEDEDEDDDDDDEKTPTLDTNVGFDWSGGHGKSIATNEESDDDSSGSSGEDVDEDGRPKSHKSRQKQSQRHKEEQEITRREIALADGTADENPESAADFERMLAGNPNSSELWIRYMAFHLTTANIPAARNVANRAFERIEFRQEQEKLNVWCALLTLELKYGTDASLQAEMDRACQHNNPKHVYLRVCEIMVKNQASNLSPVVVNKTDATFTKMCSKFRNKKTVWIAHLSYLLERGQHEEAQTVIQRALLSLPSYKHVETLSKYATLAFTYGRVTTARVVFDGLLKQHPKRLDLLFVYADQEIKHGNIAIARSLFQRVATKGKKVNSTSATNDEILSSLKFNDKQMKRLFKKWYTFEELHGSETTQEAVKDTARAYVENSLK
jgi:rRNA biogenesis protein RRP5